MERYHSTAGDPPQRLDDSRRQESLELAVLTAQFLARGGKIQYLEPQRRDSQEMLIISPAGSRLEGRRFGHEDITPSSLNRQQQADLATAIMAEAAMGNPIARVAQQLQIPPKTCLAIAKRHHVQFSA